ncbi:MAG: fibronectin type III domain-containing protein [Candidatus Dojkabacteria bacterium]
MDLQRLKILKRMKILRTISKIVLVLAGLFLLGYIGYVVFIGVKYRPYKVRVTNVTDSAFTVSWVTDTPMTGIVYYGEKDNFLPGPLSWIGKKKAVDDRDSSNAMSECVSKFNKKAAKSKDVNFTVDVGNFNCNDVKVFKYGKYYTHHITVQNLDAEKEYFFRVGDGVVSYGKNRGVYQEGEVGGVSEFKAKTFALFKDFSKPIPAYGTVDTVYRHKDGYFLLKKDFDSIVFLTVKVPDMDPILFSSVSNSDGGWSIDLSNSRMEDGTIVDISDAIMNFIPQSQNHWSARSKEYKYKDLIFPLNLAANQEEDTREEVAGVFNKFIKVSEAAPKVLQHLSPLPSTPTPNGNAETTSRDNNNESTACKENGDKGPYTYCGDCYYRYTVGGKTGADATTCYWRHVANDYTCYCPGDRYCNNVPNDAQTGCPPQEKPRGERSFSTRSTESGESSSETGEEENKDEESSDKKRQGKRISNDSDMCYDFNVINSYTDCYSTNCNLLSSFLSKTYDDCEEFRNTFNRIKNLGSTIFININTAWDTGINLKEILKAGGNVCCGNKILSANECVKLIYLSKIDINKVNGNISGCRAQWPGQSPSPVKKANKPFFHSIAQTNIQDNDMVLYLPNSGVYSVSSTTSGGSNSLYLLGGENKRYAFYEDRDGVEGYQQPADPQNPKANEDLLMTQSAIGISVSRETTAQEISLKEGINIISFNFMPSLGEKKPLSSEDFLKIANERGYEVSRISYFTGGSWNGGNVYNLEKGEVSGVPFDLVFGKGYVVVAERDVTISVPGYEIKESIPIAFSLGWNLVGIHGYSTAYTARSLIESINTIEGLKANNVTWWPTSKSMYQGYQLIDGQAYGQDYPISPLNGYFVRISEFNPKDSSCKTLWWNPGGTNNGKCDK